MKMKKLISIAALAIMFFSCSDDYSPRPVGYFRIALKPHKYRSAEIPCPFTFEYSDYAQLIAIDSAKCWYNIYYPDYGATVYLTYIKLNGDLAEHLSQTQKLTYEHEIKANKIIRKAISFPDKKVYGLKYRLSGEVASFIQFYLTDSTDHFLRGALYFNSYVNADSLAPVVEYMDAEIRYFTNSFVWK